MTDDAATIRAERFARLGELQREVSRMERELGLRSAKAPVERGSVPAWVFELVDEFGSDLISVHAANGSYEYASPSSERLFGYTPTELVGESAYVFFHPEDLERIAADHAGHDGTEDQKIRYRLRCKNGDYRWVETRSRAGLGEAGLGRIVCITRDVHDEERATQASRAATLMLAEQQRAAVAGGLLAAFNHEFNNPLLAASFALERAENELPGTSEYLADARMALDRMTSVVREMSSIVYQNWVARGRADLAAAMREVAALLPRGAAAVIREPDQPAWVSGPEAVLLQCLYHIAYSHVSGIPKDDAQKEIQLQVAVEGDQIVLRATSACSELPRVMRANVAGIVDGSSDSPDLPMGLARRLAERLGGRLENTQVESGLETRLTFPRVA